MDELLTKKPKETAKNGGNATSNLATNIQTPDVGSVSTTRPETKTQTAAQSTAPTPKSTPYQYDANTDYTAQIEKAAAAGNYREAAILEQQRNAKISGEKLDYDPTSKYASYLSGDPSYVGSVLSGTNMNDRNSIYSAYQQLISQPAEPTDLTGYLQTLYDANMRASQAAVDKQYAGYEAALNAEKEKAQLAADKSMTQEAVNAQRAQRAWNEAQSAYGLSSGAQGQVAVSRANQTQADISAIQAAQQAADAEIERQRTQYKEQYAAALLEAAANNDTQRAQALYEEMVRQDNALTEQRQQNTEWALAYLNGRAENAGKSGVYYGPPDDDDDGDGDGNYYDRILNDWYSGKVSIKQKDDLVALVNDALLGGHLTTGQANQLTAMISAGAKPGLGAGSASNRPAQTHHTWMELGK
nr:MAG TPA: hypothetical protein [Caudoviricetes sp.]